MKNKRGDVEKKKVENEKTGKWGGWRKNEVWMGKIYVQKSWAYIYDFCDKTFVAPQILV